MSSHEGRKILIVQNEAEFRLHFDHLVDSDRLSLFYTHNLYQTVKVLAGCQADSVLIAATLRSLCIENFDFFRLFNSHESWRCCCLVRDAVPFPPLLYPLIGRNRLLLMQTKQQVFEYTAEFLRGDWNETLPSGSVSSSRQSKVDAKESLLSPEELQALLISREQ